MHDTQGILRKIAALRQRLDQAQGLARDASAAAALIEREAADPRDRLEHKVQLGAEQNTLVDASLRQCPDLGMTEKPSLPRRLSARGARLLRRGRDLLQALRPLADDPLLATERTREPLSQMYHDTAAMLDTVLRSLAVFPDSPSAQVRLCDGLEAVLAVVSERLGMVRVGLT